MYFKTKETDNKPKALNLMMHYIIGVLFNIIMYYLIPAIHHRQAWEGKHSSWLYKASARAQEWESCGLSWPGQVRAKGWLLTWLPPHSAWNSKGSSSKRRCFELASCLHLQRGDSQRESVIKAERSTWRNFAICCFKNCCIANVQEAIQPA